MLQQKSYCSLWHHWNNCNWQGQICRSPVSIRWVFSQTPQILCSNTTTWSPGCPPPAVLQRRRAERRLLLPLRLHPSSRVSGRFSARLWSNLEVDKWNVTINKWFTQRSALVIIRNKQARSDQEIWNIFKKFITGACWENETSGPFLRNWWSRYSCFLCLIHVLSGKEHTIVCINIVFQNKILPLSIGTKKM